MPKLKTLNRQDIGLVKQDIESAEQDIGISTLYAEHITGLSRKTINNIEKIYREFLNREFFGRTDIVNLLGITPSPASELIKKMLDRHIICTVDGHGKGKYRFCNTGDN